MDLLNDAAGNARGVFSFPSLIVTLCLAACGGGEGGGGGGGSAPSTGSPAPTTMTITSSYMGIAYPVTIYLPAGYATSTGAKPVIYAMDHELQASAVVDAVQALGVDAIVVSIGNMGSARRFGDFDLPGATEYFKFLTLELIPRVEAGYRVDTTRRTLMGYSLSGLAAMIVLLEDGPSSRYFSGFVMADPSLQFHTTELYAMEQRQWDTTHNLPISAHHCSTGQSTASAHLQETILSRGYQGLRYQFKVYGTDHAGIVVPCVNDGLRWVFGLR